jgi:cobyrinic acid a,c-diamide synthase
MIAFLVAGTASGVGKTTVSLALMAAFRRRGNAVQAFKCGPDFLDTGHHTKICDRASRNLDTWMLSGEINRSLYAKASCDVEVVVVEGMMGLFDGVTGGREEGSAAEISKLLDLPVVLVVDAGKSGRSLAAVVKGFTTFDPALRFGGVVLNRVAGEGHFRLLEDAIKETCNLPILGWLPSETSIVIPERHLGLHTAEEFTDWEQKREQLAAFAEEHLNLDLLSQVVACSSIRREIPTEIAVPEQCVRIGIARDKAFSFYYQDNLDSLQELGAEIVPFSPLEDSCLPSDLAALYIGGGYPELFAETLSRNTSMLAAMRAFAQTGKPVYAECGGMMYLAETLQIADGQLFPMVGLLPLAVVMTEKLTRFGYTQIEFTQDCLLGKQGTITRGHSFHYSHCTPTQDISTVYRTKYTLSGREEREGYQCGNVLGSYLHLHFLANPSIAESFVRHAQRSAGVAQ